MITEALTTLLTFAAAVHEAVIATRPSVLVAVVLLLVITAAVVLLAYRNSVRILNAIFGTVTYRVSQMLGSLKTSVVCKFRQIIPRRSVVGGGAIPEVEFDDLDLAVLSTASSLGPGFTISAPELAGRFSLRPAQVQRSLSKLCANKMLEYVIGSTEGFDNYRLTQLGTAFMSTWQRQASRA